MLPFSGAAAHRRAREENRVPDLPALAPRTRQRLSLAGGAPFSASAGWPAAVRLLFSVSSVLLPLALPLGCAERLPGPVPVIRPRGLGTRSRSHRSLSGLVWFLELEGTPRAQWPARAPQCAARPSARERPAGRMDAGFG